MTEEQFLESKGIDVTECIFIPADELNPWGKDKLIDVKDLLREYAELKVKEAQQPFMETTKTKIMETTTKLEKEVLEIISWGDEYEGTPAECFDTIFESFDGTKDQLKGVIGSLEKKELIWIGEYPNGLNSYHLQ